MPARRLGWISALVVVCLSTAVSRAADGCKLMMTSPIPVRIHDLRPVITGNINGTEAEFIVDTGSFFDFISPAAAAQFKLPLSNAPFGLFVTGVGGSETPQIATAATFTVAGISVHKAKFLVGNNDFQGGESGLLGQNLFRMADMEFDFADGVLRFVRPQHCGGHVLAYWAGTQPVGTITIHGTSPQQPHLTGKVSVNGRAFEALFDTGSPHTILSLRAAKRAGITTASPGVVAAGFTAGTGKDFVKVWVAPIDEFEIGGEKIEHTHVLIGDIDLRGFGAEMLLGMDFFLAHHIYVAYSQNSLYFTYNGGRVFDLNEARPGQTASTSKIPDSPRATDTPSGPAAVPATQPGPGQSNGPAVQQSAGSLVSNAPADAAGFMRRGMAHISRHEYPEAIADLTHACDLDPADADCRYQRGLAYWYDAQRERALRDLNAAIQLQPNGFAAHLARAQFELRQHPADAQNDLDVVDHLAPQEADLRLTLAGLYGSAGEHAAAIHQYDLWIEYHGEDNRLSFALGNRCGAEAMANVDLDRALEDCNKALKAIPKNAPVGASAAAIANRSMVYLRQGSLDSALADCDAALRLLPKLAEARYERGLVELRRGLKDQGRSDLAAAEAQEPGITKRFIGLGLTP